MVPVAIPAGFTRYEAPDQGAPLTCSRRESRLPSIPLIPLRNRRGHSRVVVTVAFAPEPFLPARLATIHDRDCESEPMQERHLLAARRRMFCDQSPRDLQGPG